MTKYTTEIQIRTVSQKAMNYKTLTNRFSTDLVAERRVSAQQYRQQMSTLRTANSPPMTPAASTTAVTVGDTLTPPPLPTTTAPAGPTVSTRLSAPSDITYNSRTTSGVVLDSAERVVCDDWRPIISLGYSFDHIDAATLRPTWSLVMYW